MNTLSILFRVSLIVVCSGLVSCDDVRSTIARSQENKVKMDGLIAEGSKLDENLQVLKTALPRDVTSGEIAAVKVERMRKDLEFLEQQLAKEVEKHEASAQQLQAAEKELESLRR